MSDTSLKMGELYAGYATDETVRAAAASGGIVSCLLVELLASGRIDGALVSALRGSGGRVRAVTELASTREAVLDHGGSVYVDTPVVETLRALPESAGRVAVVCLPCQARVIRRLLGLRPDLAGRVGPVIALFCRGNVTEALYEDLCARLGIAPGEIESVKVSRERVRGAVCVRLRGGSERRFPFLLLNAYRIAGCHQKPMCAWCTEHLGEAADVAVGDMFLPGYLGREPRHGAFVARTELGLGVVEAASGRGRIACELVGMETYRRLSRKTARFTDSDASRFIAARLTGQRRPRTPKTGRFSAAQAFAWTIIYANARLSRSRLARRVLRRLPRFVVYGAAYLVKILSRL